MNHSEMFRKIYDIHQQRFEGFKEIVFSPKEEKVIDQFLSLADEVVLKLDKQHELSKEIIERFSELQTHKTRSMLNILRSKIYWGLVEQGVDESEIEFDPITGRLEFLKKNIRLNYGFTNEPLEINDKIMKMYRSCWLPLPKETFIEHLEVRYWSKDHTIIGTKSNPSYKSMFCRKLTKKNFNNFVKRLAKVLRDDLVEELS